MHNKVHHDPKTPYINNLLCMCVLVKDSDMLLAYGNKKIYQKNTKYNKTILECVCVVQIVQVERWQEGEYRCVCKYL